MREGSQSEKKSRKNSYERSFHSIDEFRESSIDAFSRSNKFPLRPSVNILLILLTTLQVYILLSSRIYLRGELVRTFLSVYIDSNNYPDLFAGNEFYIQVVNIEQFHDHFDFLFKRINQIENDSFIDLDYKNSKFLLHTQYKSLRDNSKRDTIHEIDPNVGIVKPFDMKNLTSIQLYLLEVEQFQLRVENLTMKENWEGFSEKYVHEITYQYLNSIKIRINFNFRIDNAMINDDEDDQTGEEGGQDKIKVKDSPGEETPYPIEYIIKVRVFYSFIMILAIFSLYLNYISVRQTFKVLYEELEARENNNQPKNIPSTTAVINEEPSSLLRNEEIQYIREDVRKWVKANEITLHQLSYKHYFHLLEFDIIFSVMSNVFQIIAGFYLISGIQRERLAGIACLFSWMTIFKFLRKYKKLVLMYELIKLSISKVLMFFVEFLPVFLSYALLGICLFPKVSFFSSLADSVTTLVCLMMGDSIQMITNGIIEKNSIILAVIYIFSFVLMFMHAIHNTLTSLIKQFFIIKKIQLVREEKERLKDQKYIYIDEIKIQSQIDKNDLPLKLTNDLQRSLLRIYTLKRVQGFKEILKFYWSQIDRIRMYDSWVIEECSLRGVSQAKEELIRRALFTHRLLETISKEKVEKNLGDQNNMESMITDGK